MAKITAPAKGFTGESFGVAFSNGVGETEDRWLIQRFKEHGYTVEDDKKSAPKQEADTDESGKSETKGTGKGKTTKSKS